MMQRWKTRWRGSISSRRSKEENWKAKEGAAAFQFSSFDLRGLRSLRFENLFHRNITPLARMRTAVDAVAWSRLTEEALVWDRGGSDARLCFARGGGSLKSFRLIARVPCRGRFFMR